MVAWKTGFLLEHCVIIRIRLANISRNSARLHRAIVQMEVVIGELKRTLRLCVGGWYSSRWVAYWSHTDLGQLFYRQRLDPLFQLRPRNLTGSENHAQAFPSVSLRYYDNNERRILKCQFLHNLNKLLGAAISNEATMNIRTYVYRSLLAIILLSWSFSNHEVCRSVIKWTSRQSDHCHLIWSYLWSRCWAVSQWNKSRLFRHPYDIKPSGFQSA